MSKAKIEPPKEAAEQAAFFEWAAHLKTLKWAFAIPNGGSRHKAEAMHLKKQGVKRGVSDIFIPVPRNGLHGLFIEMKRTKGGRISPEQKEFIAAMTAAGYGACVCFGAHDAIDAVKEYMGWKRNTKQTVSR